MIRRCHSGRFDAIAYRIGRVAEEARAKCRISLDLKLGKVWLTPSITCETTIAATNCRKSSTGLPLWSFMLTRYRGCAAFRGTPSIPMVGINTYNVWPTDALPQEHENH